MDDKSIQKIKDNGIVGKVVERKEDIKIVAQSLIKNIASQIPVLGVATDTAADYLAAMVNKKRDDAVNSFISNINKRLEAVEVKQEAIDYFENSIVFRLEEVTIKIISNPDKGYEEILAEYVASALSDLKTPPETKDLILSTLLSLDSVDLLVLKTMDKHFIANLHGRNGARGVTRDSLATLLKESGIDDALINRSIQRLQSEFVIQPLKVSVPALTESPTADELYKGKRPAQYDATEGYVNTDFGRVFINFLKLNG